MSPSSLFVVLTLGGFCVAAQIPGGYNDINVNSPEAKKAMRFIVKERLKQSNEKVVVVKVTRAEKQVVKGFNYRLTFEARICKKGKVCVSTENEPPQHCVAVVFQALNGKRGLTSFECHKPSSKP
ncbi:salivary cystatin-L-like [Ornithodoros turicata]|uniref:salivary cystatin-L-like n=1 Tax=Ornithodoros turicata TaxID=34597 RepID=UPI003139A357